MGITIEFEGVGDVVSSIKKFTRQVEENIKKALEESSVNIEGKARQKAPVLTGNLKRAITHKMVDDGFTGEIGTYDVEYAPHVEYGTSKTPARPYLRPSLEEELPNLKTLLERAINEAGV